MQDNPEKFSEIVKHFRTRAGLTVEKVAEQADITERYLYRIENETGSDTVKTGRLHFLPQRIGRP